MELFHSFERRSGWKMTISVRKQGLNVIIILKIINDLRMEINTTMTVYDVYYQSVVSDDIESTENNWTKRCHTLLTSANVFQIRSQGSFKVYIGKSPNSNQFRRSL